MNQPFTLNQWRVDPASGLIEDGEASIRLDPKTLDVLMALVMRSGEVVGRGELMDQVWPNQIVSDDRLTTAISTLRKSLGDTDTARRVIETIPKKGYRLLAELSHETPAVASSSDRSAGSSTRALGKPGLAAALVVAVLALVAFWLQTEAPVPVVDGSIAVLPFEVFIDDEEVAYFADGLTEELIHQLSFDPELRVISRTSSFKFRDSEQPMADIAQALGVQLVLEGSIRGQRDRLRITIQLIDAQNDVHLWSQTIDASYDDLLASQEAVSQEVMARISGGRVASMVPTQLRHPVPQEAYQFYLLGQSNMRLGTVEGYARAAGYFSDAFTIAPNYAIALTQYAAVTMLLHQYRNDPLAEASERARVALDRALTIDPDLAEAMAVYGLMHTYNGAFVEAESAYREALERRPNLSFARHNYGFMLWNQSRFEETIEQVEQALALDPISGSAFFLLGDSHAALGAFNQASGVYEQCLSVMPDNHQCLLGAASIERILGRIERATMHADQAARRLDPDYFYLLTTQLGLSMYGDDPAVSVDFDERASQAKPDNHYLLRTRMIRWLRDGQLDDYIDDLSARLSARPGDMNIGMLLAHAYYLQGDCGQMDETYAQLDFDDSSEWVSHWEFEFGQSHLLNIVHCQINQGSWSPESEGAAILVQLLDRADSVSVPGGWWVLARLMRLSGDEAGAERMMSRLSDHNWPFLWLESHGPAWPGTQ
ncbi:MAG: winged helix-turn-helix domain-containing protein [Pseudomonadota bacterium]